MQCSITTKAGNPPNIFLYRHFLCPCIYIMI
nr:MAG TPA: hypothetical protein [Caudoviricetes sp.]